MIKQLNIQQYKNSQCRSTASHSMSMGRSVGFTLSYNFAIESRSSSPYLNHFLQPDSIVPNPSNPQGWNRYSYVLNNPINFTDPSGHCSLSGHWMPDSDPACQWSSSNQGSLSGNGNGGFVPSPGGGHGGEGNGGGNGENYCNTHPGSCGNQFSTGTYAPLPSPPGFCPVGYTLTQCFNANLPLYMGDYPIQLDPSEFIDLLFAISADVYQQTPGELKFAAAWYDTPFYDHSFYGYGKYKGVGCIYGRCYSRDELNYIAEGALWARVGLSKAGGHAIVWRWKLTLPIMHWPTKPSKGTMEMFDIGYNTYLQIYPSGPPGPVPEPMWP